MDGIRELSPEETEKLRKLALIPEETLDGLDKTWDDEMGLARANLHDSIRFMRLQSLAQGYYTGYNVALDEVIAGLTQAASMGEMINPADALEKLTAWREGWNT